MAVRSLGNGRQVRLLLNFRERESDSQKGEQEVRRFAGLIYDNYRVTE